MNYIDTSALIKYYSDEGRERGVKAVTDLVEAAKRGDNVLLSSFFVVGEAISAFDKRVRQKIISQDEFDITVKKFLADIKNLTVQGALVLEPVTSSEIINCLQLIIGHHLSINDAIHLYTALANRDMVELFVCSDGNLLKAAKAEGLEVLNPEEQ